MTLANTTDPAAGDGFVNGLVVTQVTQLLASALGIEDRLHELTPDTGLLDSLPELDSMAIIDVILAIEETFGIEVDESEITGDVFESINSLASFVQSQVVPTTG